MAAHPYVTPDVDTGIAWLRSTLDGNGDTVKPTWLTEYGWGESTDAADRYHFPAMSTTDGANGGPVYTFSVTAPPDYTVVGNANQQVTVQADHGVEANFTLQALPCRFVLGFQALHVAIPTVVGNCLDDEQHNPTNGDALQQTTKGLLAWRKADNFTAFTDGYGTWVDGPDGVRERLNDQRFPWEANPNTCRSSSDDGPSHSPRVQRMRKISPLGAKGRWWPSGSRKACARRTCRRSQ
jgi:hypothetical protein